MTESCPIEGDVFIEHEHHRNGVAPKAKVKHRVKGLFGLSACAVPGISLTNYNLNAAQKGWGKQCTQAHTTVTLSNGVRFTVTSAIAELSRLVLNECIRRGYNVRQTDTGAYNCRYISGTTVWSNHAWGLAIDVNWQSNPYTSARVTDKPQWLFDLFNRYGFANGADYTGAHDWMHHEFMGTPAQAAAATALAVKELSGVKPVPTPVPAPAPAPVADPQVKQDQINLNDTGFGCGTPDGIWGPVSIEAAKAFQRAAGLPVDGVFGPASRAAIAKVPSWSGAFIGSGGYSALQWQQKLADHGWNIELDGIWGDHSTSILRQYQTDKRLVNQSGLGNAESWTSLYTTVN